MGKKLKESLRRQKEFASKKREKKLTFTEAVNFIMSKNIALYRRLR